MRQEDNLKIAIEAAARKVREQGGTAEVIFDQWSDSEKRRTDTTIKVLFSGPPRP